MGWVDASPRGMPDAQGRGQKEDSRCDSHFEKLAMKQRQRLAECAPPGADPTTKMIQLQHVSPASRVRPIEDAGCGVADRRRLGPPSVGGVLVGQGRHNFKDQREMIVKKSIVGSASSHHGRRLKHLILHNGKPTPSVQLPCSFAARLSQTPFLDFENTIRPWSTHGLGQKSR
jgi:hypothetical protein